MTAKSKKKKKNMGAAVKKIVTVSLLALVAASVIALVVKGTAVKKGQAAEGPRALAEKKGSKVIAYYFHGTHRCWSCNTIEEYSKEAIDTGFRKQLDKGSLEFISINVDRGGNRQYLEKYNVASKMLVLVLVKDGKEIKYEPMPNVWRLLRDKQAFIEYVRQGVKKYLDEV